MAQSLYLWLGILASLVVIVGAVIAVVKWGARPARTAARWIHASTIGRFKAYVETPRQEVAELTRKVIEITNLISEQHKVVADQQQMTKQLIQWERGNTEDHNHIEKRIDNESRRLAEWVTEFQGGLMEANQRIADLQTALGAILEGMPLDQSPASQRIRQAGRAVASAGEQQKLVLSPGDHVMHRLFGEGTVLQITEDKGAHCALISFKTAGKKTVDLAYASLRKL